MVHIMLLYYTFQPCFDGGAQIEMGRLNVERLNKEVERLVFQLSVALPSVAPCVRNQLMALTETIMR